MRVYLDKDVIKKKTGWESENIWFIIRIYIEQTGATDILLSPEDYLNVYFECKSDTKQSRTKDNRPCFSIAGIKFIMLSLEDVDKYKVLM